MNRRELFKGALAMVAARLIPVGVGASLAARVAQGPGERGMALARKFGATGFSQPGIDYAQRTGHIGFFTDKVGRAVGWLRNDGTVLRTIPSRVAARVARGYELDIREVGRAW